MPLITCPSCKERISDDVFFCPNCGSTLEKEIYVVCKDCKNTYSSALMDCPNCGSPKKFTRAVQLKKNKLLPIGIVIILGIALFYFITSVVNSSKQRNAELNFYNNCVDAYNSILDGATMAEDVGILTIVVWENSIDQIQDAYTDRFTMENGKFLDDFNDALNNLFEDDEYIQYCDSIRSNKTESYRLLKQLGTVPDGYEELYSSIKDMYDCYEKFTAKALRPKGSYNSFSEEFYTIRDELIDCIDKSNQVFEYFEIIYD